VLSDSFVCNLGVRQGESLSAFLFHLNYIDEYFMTNGFDGVDIGMLKLFVLLHTYIIVFLSENETGLQNGLDLLECYCDRWKLCKY